MDLWVVAAAAGAGYVAKFLKKTKERDGELGVEESSGKLTSKSNFEHFGDNSSPIRKLGQRKIKGEERREEGVVSSNQYGFVASEVASTSGVEGEMLGNCRSIEDYNVLSFSCLSPRFITKTNEEDSTMGSGNTVDKSSCRSKGAIRIKTRGYSVKPVSSIDSCLEAHLYNEHNMEEYLFGSLPSASSSTMRPLIVTDGRRVISRASSDSCSLQYNSCKESGLYSDVKEKIMGVPPLPEIAPLQIPKKVKQKRRKEPHGRFGGSNKKFFGRQLHSQGASDRMFLFCLGITFGVLSTVVANKREVDKLNKLLKETKNLVEDLHEELEMKDSVTVKVLNREGGESQENRDRYFPNQALTSFSSVREMNESLEYDIKTVDQQSGENFDSMSKIEAELEAELERLELNINTTSRERRLSGLVEIDPDSLADIIQGELRVDMVSRVAGVESDSRKDTSGTSTTKTHNANYAVSPRELSLRLHEVIQSRLEERITELETALENSQKRLHSVESKPVNPWRNYSTSEMGSSSHESPTTREPDNTITQPLFLNLSNDALDAYKEAYEALNIRIAGTDDDSPPFTVYKSSQKEELHSSDRSVLWSQNEGGENGSESNEVIEIYNGSDDDGEEEDDDEMRRLLIKKLVEKTRQGSPVVLNAQRMLFSMDEKSPLG